MKKLIRKGLDELRKGGEYLGICRVFQAMEQVADRFFISHYGPSHAVHRWLAQAGTAEMIAATAVRKFPATAGAERGLQIRDQEQAIWTNCLLGAGKTPLAESTAAGKDQLHTALTPFFPGNHRGTKQEEDKRT